jgi:tetratricopeptide (TPR) repeat protein
VGDLSANRQKLLICLALAVGTASVYWPLHRYDFVNYDDVDYILENAHVRAGLTLEGVRWAFVTGHDYWHPLTWLSHMTDVQMFGLHAGAHHLVSVLFHILNSLLLFLLLARMTGALWQSALVAALFAWHPLHVESTAWIAERKDVLSTFFGLLSLWAYVGYAESRRRRHLFLALLWFTSGLMTKPMLVTLPFAFLLLDYWPLKRIRSISGVDDVSLLLKEKAPFFVLSLISSIVTYATARNVGAIVNLENIPVGYRFVNALLACAGYLQKTFFPTNLAVIYPISWVFSWWEVVGALILLVAISLAAVYWAKQRPWLLVGWLWFLGMLVPVIGLIQVGSQSMADRYTYLSLAGFFVMLVWEGAQIAAASRFAKKLVVTGSIAVLAALMPLTWMQVQTWSDSQALFEHAVGVTKNNYIAHGILGRVLANSGRVDEAQAHFEEVLRIMPNKADAHFSLGVILAQKGKSQEAIAHYKQALDAQPDAATHYNLGNLLMKSGRPEEAIAHFSEAARLNPQMAEAQNNWAYALTIQGRIREAADHYAEALRIKPDLAEASLNIARIREELASTH